MHQNAQLSHFSLVVLVIASMIGAGVFTTSGFALSDLRSPSLVMLAWLVGGLIAICGAISYGRLAILLTENGGEYLFLSRFVHPAAGFVAGWVSFLAGFTGAGAYAALAFETYALPEEQRPAWLPPGVIGAILVVVVTLAHALNTRRGAMRQNVLVAIKLVLLLLFVGWSIANLGQWTGGQTLPVENDAEPVTLFTFATSVMWISLSYCGFNAAIYVAGEAGLGATEDGGRSVSRAMVQGTLLVTLLYLLLNAIFVYAAPASSVAGVEYVAAVAASSIGGSRLDALVRIAICCGLASSASSVVMAGPRVYAKMAEEGVFPRWFDSPVSPPTRSVWLQGGAILLVLGFSNLQQLLSYLSLTLSLTAAMTVGVLVWRATRLRGQNVVDDAEERGSNQVPLYAVAAAVVFVTATLVTAGLTAWHRPMAAQATIYTLLAGLFVYCVLAWSRRAGGEHGSSR